MKRFPSIILCVTLFGLSTLLAQAGGGSWGTVTGRITWGGAVNPEMAVIVINNPDGPACQKNGPLKDETWIVNATNKGLRHTFVWIAPQQKGDKLLIHPDLKAVPKDKIIIDQPLCVFIPHALALREGQVLVAKNGAAMAHNFKWTGNPTANPGGNVLLPPGSEKEIDDLKADRLPVAVECNIHPWMRGWVRVFDHPYYAITDADGAFTIKNAPTGDYKLMIWHGSGGWLGGAKGKDGRPISIKTGENKTGDLAYPPPAN